MKTCETIEGVEVMTDPFRTIQIHPTRRCNLACLHCYSSSAPHLKDAINIEALKNFLSIAYDNGFNNISVSGGEPFLYKDLEVLLRFTKKIGYQNTIASNGMLLKSERSKAILEHVDIIALSIDGPETLHDHIRGQAGAFEKMMEGVAVLKSLEKTFGFIHTVTPQSWESLIWLAEFAFDNGAKLLQLHPLEMSGRAVDKLVGFTVDDTLAHQIFILANYLQSKYSGHMIVQLDLLHKDYLKAFPQIVNSFERSCSKKQVIGDLLDTIIVEENGRVLPFSYGFASKFEIGNIENFDEHTFNNYLEHKIGGLRSLFKNTLDEIFVNEDADIVNWNEILVNASNVV